MQDRWSRKGDVIRVFLAGDVMTGRAIDQLFATHNNDEFGKPNTLSAKNYLAWSAQLHGIEMLPVRHDYIWGAALGVLDAARPDFRLANLETAITTCDAWEDKVFTFRMHPANVGCLAALDLDCVALANNHVLDFGVDGLLETLQVLKTSGIGYCGAGVDETEAGLPHVHVLPGGKRILVFSWAFSDSGVTEAQQRAGPGTRTRDWRAGPGTPGIQHIESFDPASARHMSQRITAHSRPGDLVIASLHWGGNWVEKVPDAHRVLARHLIDHAGVDIVHGHSAHHVLPAEQYKGKLILYGCGDLVNDSEGRPDRRENKGHLGALYFADIDRQTHHLVNLVVLPVERRRFRLEMPSRQDSDWVISQLKNI